MWFEAIGGRSAPTLQVQSCYQLVGWAICLRLCAPFAMTRAGAQGVLGIVVKVAFIWD